MIRNILALLLFINSAWAVCTKISMPTDYSVVTNGTRANLKANFTETQVRVNPCMDSVDEVRARLSGYSTNLAITSLENLRLKLDGDASGTAKLIVETSNGDSLFRVSEDSSAKFFGPVTFTAAPVFSSVTASLPLAVNGSKALITSPVTGTGSTVVMSAAPALSGTVTSSGDINGNSGKYFLDATNGRIGAGLASPAYTIQGRSAATNGQNLFGLQTSAPITVMDFVTDGAGNGIMAVRNSAGTSKIELFGGSGNINATGLVTADSISCSKFYEEGSFTSTFRGCSADPTGTAYYVRIGKHVTLSLPYFTCTADSAGAAITGLPASIQPTRAQGFPVNIVENGTNTNNTSSGFVVSGSAVRIYIGTSPSALFLSSGTRQVPGNMGSGGMTTINYLLN